MVNGFFFSFMKLKVGVIVLVGDLIFMVLLVRGSFGCLEEVNVLILNLGFRVWKILLG